MMRMHRKASTEAIDQYIDDRFHRDRYAPTFIAPVIIEAVLRQLEDATTALALTGAAGAAGVRVEFSVRAVRAD